MELEDLVRFQQWLHERGWAGVKWPVEYGGTGWTAVQKYLFGIEMAKSHTRADWTKRPLREAYLQYAAEDVEHLLPAFDKLSEQLEREGRLEWAREDSRALLDARLYEIDATQALENEESWTIGLGVLY